MWAFYLHHRNALRLVNYNSVGWFKRSEAGAQEGEHSLGHPSRSLLVSVLDLAEGFPQPIEDVATDFPIRPFVLDVADLRCDLLSWWRWLLRRAGHEHFPLLRQAQSASMEIHSLEHHASKRQKTYTLCHFGKINNRAKNAMEMNCSFSSNFKSWPRSSRET